jgi:hypothetical protein
MNVTTLGSDFYREQAQLCHKLAESSTAAKPLFARLCLLAKAYEEKAEAAESKLTPGQAAENFSVRSSVERRERMGRPVKAVG